MNFITYNYVKVVFIMYDNYTKIYYILRSKRIIYYVFIH